MAQSQIIKYFLVFAVTLLPSCLINKKEEIIRVWKVSNLHTQDTLLRDTTSNVYYDFEQGECHFSNDIINTLYEGKEYSVIYIKDKIYYLFKKDEFFKHPIYKSLKVGILADTNLSSMTRAYYVMENYGIVAIFDQRKRTNLELQEIIIKKDTTQIQSFYPQTGAGR